MKPKILLVILTFVFVHCIALAQNPLPYGNNKNAGQYISIHGVNHYYETYGAGQPLLLLHGNGTGISGWGPQIAYFSRYYKVFALDNRGRGKSSLGKDTLSYIQLAEDVAAFIKVMQLDSVLVIGKSDGGILGLLLGVYFPEHIQKIVAFGANIVPDTTALHPRTVEEMKSIREKAEFNIGLKDTSSDWKTIALRYRMMEFQPHISKEQLQKIKIPVLVMSCDRDLIKEEHSLYIYKNIPKANLCILPGETHFICRQNPDLFNTTVKRYLDTPFKSDSYRFNH